jgi:hypothetical protein
VGANTLLFRIFERALTQLKVMGDRTGKKADVAYGGIVDRRYETIHRTGIAASDRVLERDSFACCCIDAIGIDEVVRKTLRGVARGTGIGALVGSLL